MVKTNSQIAAEGDEEIPCTPTRVVVKKMASLLVKPKVSYVSLVGHAANGLHFGIIKTEDGPATLNQPTNNDPMPKAAIPAFGSAGASLNRLEFDLTLFKNEADVEAYLKESNITATRILKTETHYIVPGVHEDSLDQIEAVKGDKEGVTYFIGKIKAPLASRITPPTSQVGTKIVPVAKKEADPKARLRGDEEENAHELVFKSEAAPELVTVVQKMDSYIARQIKTTDVDATLNTGTPEIPGLYEIMAAVRITVENIVSLSDAADFSAKIEAAFARGGQIASGLAGIFVSVKKSEDGTETNEVDRDAIKKHFSSTEPEAAKVAVVPVVVTKSEPPAVPAATPDIAAIVAEAVQKSIGPVVESVNALAVTVETVQKSAAESAEKLEGRLMQVEEVRQVRKSLPDDGETTVAKSEKEIAEEVRKSEKLKAQEVERKADEEFAARQRRSRLGII